MFPSHFTTDILWNFYSCKVFYWYILGKLWTICTTITICAILYFLTKNPVTKFTINKQYINFFAVSTLFVLALLPADINRALALAVENQAY